RTIVGDLQSVGDELNDLADGTDADAELCRLCLVDLQRPVDAGEGQAAVEVADRGVLRELRGDPLGGRSQCVGIVAGQLDLHGLAGGWSRLRGAYLDLDARDVRGDVADLVHQRVGWRTLLPVDELELNLADHVLGDVAAQRAAAVARIAGARVDV